MKEALEKVNLWGFLQAQQGLSTPVLERGSSFSGGQCQRLAIARALLHDTPVYIFDEATSNIDAESEEMIMDVIYALARALLHDTPVYIFDEATSNIDVESEEMIMEVIRELAKTRTVLLISHRLANVVNADRIYMMKDGSVSETGAHEELMEQNGDYANLYRAQMVLEQYGKEATA